MQLTISKTEMEAAANAVGLRQHERDALATGQATLTLSLQEEEKPGAAGDPLVRREGESQTQHARRMAAWMRSAKPTADSAVADQVAALVEKRVGARDVGDLAVAAMGWDRGSDPDKAAAEVERRVRNGEADAVDRAAAAMLSTVDSNAAA